jgi:hypothetical protein
MHAAFLKSEVYDLEAGYAESVVVLLDGKALGRASEIGHLPKEGSGLAGNGDVDVGKPI